MEREIRHFKQDEEGVYAIFEGDHCHCSFDCEMVQEMSVKELSTALIGLLEQADWLAREIRRRNKNAK